MVNAPCVLRISSRLLEFNAAIEHAAKARQVDVMVLGQVSHDYLGIIACTLVGLEVKF